MCWKFCSRWWKVTFAPEVDTVQKICNQGEFSMLLVPHLTSAFLSFLHISYHFFRWNVCAVSSVMWPQFLRQACFVHENCLYITLPVGSYFAGRYLDCPDCFPRAFIVAYANASHSSLSCSVFKSDYYPHNYSKGGLQIASYIYLALFV